MGYRDDFYIPGNIVGYTGSLNLNPTVYFESRLNGDITFGRITQDHDDPSNIGRGLVRTARDYQSYNRHGKHKEHAHSINFKHTSRSLFKPRVNSDTLSRAIARFPNLKPKNQ
jgi:hypothetical protein